MPKITINENEEISLATFDATENCVLIPILYPRDYSEDSEGNVQYIESANIPGKRYVSALDFRNDYLSAQKVVTVDGQRDRSYAMAYELLLQGMTVIIKPITYDNYNLGKILTGDQAYDIIDTAILDGALEEFRNRNIYNIKFITSGGYANCGQHYLGEVIDSSGSTVVTEKITQSYAILRELAKDRGDAVALIEFRELFVNEAELFESLNYDYEASDDDVYAAGFFPWCDNHITSDSTNPYVKMPACYQYLMAYANSVKFNSNWFAASGVQRGEIPGFRAPRFEVGEALMHILQGDSDEGAQLNVSVNPIYNAGTYGYKIWGNRVMNKNTARSLRYMNFLNVRILLCDLKKQLYHAAMRITFEPNDDIAWVSYKTLNNPLLDKMKSGRGIKYYNWIKESVTEKATLRAVLEIRPIEALENIEVNIVLTDEEATIEENVSTSGV